jgi:hypothetical protein
MPAENEHKQTHAGPSADPAAEMTAEEKRHDQYLRAPKSDEAAAAPRIETTDVGDGVTRIDVADTAAVRPGKPA